MDTLDTVPSSAAGHPSPDPESGSQVANRLNLGCLIDGHSTAYFDVQVVFEEVAHVGSEVV